MSGARHGAFILPLTPFPAFATSFHLFEASMENKDYEEALRAVHTLKGICQNLSFTRLFESSSLVTNALKGNDWSKAVDMMPKLSKDYYETINVIKDFKNSREE